MKAPLLGMRDACRNGGPLAGVIVGCTLKLWLRCGRTRPSGEVGRRPLDEFVAGIEAAIGIKC